MWERASAWRPGPWC
ncbi:MAG: hypothetical protein ACKOEU_13300 [Limnohabitans sp.]